jgi:hypothetical protein
LHGLSVAVVRTPNRETEQKSAAPSSAKSSPFPFAPPEELLIRKPQLIPLQPSDVPFTGRTTTFRDFDFRDGKTRLPQVEILIRVSEWTTVRQYQLSSGRELQ